MPEIAGLERQGFGGDVAVFGAPGRYIQGRGALRFVGPCAATLGASAILLFDAAVRDGLAGPVVESCAACGVEATTLSFSGELRVDTGARLEALAGRAASAVVAIGGGRAVDAGKALAERLGSGLVTVPTAASNDAPTSRIFVLYDDSHRLVEARDSARSPDFVIVDTDILATAPKALFRAGLGDAVAKKFEADACRASAGRTTFGARQTRLAGRIADACYETLVLHGARAWDAAGTGQPTEDFDAAVEAMILMAGLGFENGGLSLPHALTRGVPLLPGGGAVAHGIQVAWGLIVHFELLGQQPPAELVSLYRAVGLPLSLGGMAIAFPSDADLAVLAEATLAARHVRNLPLRLDADLLSGAIRRTEAKERGAS